MTLLLTTVICIILIELALHLPLMGTVSKISFVADKALRTLATGSISDHWKEKVMPAYARSLFSLSMKLGALLTLIGAVGSLLVYATALLDIAVNRFITSLIGLLFSTAVAMGYLKIRKLLVRFR